MEMSSLIRLLFRSPGKASNFQSSLQQLCNAHRVQNMSTLALLSTKKFSSSSTFYYVKRDFVKASSYYGVLTRNKIAIRRDNFSTSASESDSKHIGHLVYQGRVGNMFRALKIFSLSTSAIGLCLQPYLLMTCQDMPLKLAIPIFAAMNIFVVVNPILIHYIAKKYILELYFNPDTKVFTAVMLTFLAKKETFSFTAKDVHCPDVPNMFAMFTAKNRPLFAHEADFTDLDVYKHLMGFDVPLDLTVGNTDAENKT
ncbi:hypothetical protein Btru_011175 [Bulinus truncatus]|nr:hypothetical protein Btru_011175 [Bulinus truncatus]